MYELTASPKPPQTWSAILVRYALLAAILLALIGVLFAHRAWTARRPASTRAATEFISASPIEDRYGIRVTLVGVTAAGGLVNFRFKVLDAEKAKEIVQDPENMPMLIAEDSGTTLKAPGTVRHNITLETGRGYYILYINTQGAIKPGTPVSVVIGDLRLEHMIAQ